MRNLNNITGRYRSQKRVFSSEFQFLKFAEPRDEEHLANLLLDKSRSSLGVAGIEIVKLTEATSTLRMTKMANGI
jgi:hypothetical protein